MHSASPWVVLVKLTVEVGCEVRGVSGAYWPAFRSRRMLMVGSCGSGAEAAGVALGPAMAFGAISASAKHGC